MVLLNGIIFHLLPHAVALYGGGSPELDQYGTNFLTIELKSIPNSHAGNKRYCSQLWCTTLNVLCNGLICMSR